MGRGRGSGSSATGRDPHRLVQHGAVEVVDDAVLPRLQSLDHRRLGVAVGREEVEALDDLLPLHDLEVDPHRLVAVVVGVHHGDADATLALLGLLVVGLDGLHEDLVGLGDDRRRVHHHGAPGLVDLVARRRVGTDVGVVTHAIAVRVGPLGGVVREGVDVVGVPVAVGVDRWLAGLAGLEHAAVGERATKRAVGVAVVPDVDRPGVSDHRITHQHLVVKEFAELGPTHHHVVDGDGVVVVLPRAVVGGAVPREIEGDPRHVVVRPALDHQCAVVDERGRRDRGRWSRLGGMRRRAAQTEDQRHHEGNEGRDGPAHVCASILPFRASMDDASTGRAKLPEM